MSQALTPQLKTSRGAVAGPPEAVEEDGRWVVAIVSAANDAAEAEALRLCRSTPHVVCVSEGPELVQDSNRIRGGSDEDYVYNVGGLLLPGSQASPRTLETRVRLARILRSGGDEGVRVAARRMRELAAAHGASVDGERLLEVVVEMHEKGLLEDPLRPLCPLTGMECPCESCIAVLRSEGVTPCGVVALQ